MKASHRRWTLPVAFGAMLALSLFIDAAIPQDVTSHSRTKLGTIPEFQS